MCIVYVKKEISLSTDPKDYIQEFYPNIKNSKEFQNILQKIDPDNLDIFAFYKEYEISIN